MPAIVLIGAQWGDEGKGKATDLLGGSVQWVVRYQGGNNAGRDAHDPAHICSCERNCARHAPCHVGAKCRVCCGHRQKIWPDRHLGPGLHEASGPHEPASRLYAS